MKKNIVIQLLTFVLVSMTCIALAACGVKSEEGLTSKSKDIKESTSEYHKNITNESGDDSSNKRLPEQKGESGEAVDGSGEAVDESGEAVDESEETGDYTLLNELSDSEKEQMVADITSFQFSLDNKEFDLKADVKIQDIINLGYSFKKEDILDEELEPGEYTSTTVITNSTGGTLSISACNKTDDTVKFKDASLYGLKFEYNTRDDSKNVNFYLIGEDALRFGVTTLEEFDSVFTADDIYDSTDYNTRTFKVSSEEYHSDNKVRFVFTKGLLGVIEIDFI